MIDCARFKDLVYRYLDDELAETERVGFERHGEECGSCGRSLDAERLWDTTLRSQFERHCAPPGLRERIHAGLSTAGGRSAVSSPWMRLRPALSAAAAVLIVVALAATPLKVLNSRGAEGPGSVIAAMTVEGQVVDLHCDKVGLSIEQQRRCTKADHLNAVKAADGHYYAMLDRGAAHDLLFGASIRGARISIVGHYDRGLDVFEVDSYELDDPAGVEAGETL